MTIRPDTIRPNLSDWTPATCDVLVIGGGATGLGVAVHAALEGRSVVLVEARDFASGTSSRSTKLLHGGVRYLAQGRIQLVREALRERAIVLGLAPHLAQPLPFVVHERRWGSWAMTAVGLKLYQWLAGRLSLGPTEVLSQHDMNAIAPVLPGTVAGVRYWDGQFEDARLALALAQTAQAAGAKVRNHVRVVGLLQQGGGWQVSLQDALNGQTATIYAACVVNAAGVWVDALRQLAFAPAHPESSPESSSVAVEAPKLLQALVKPSQGAHWVIDRALLPLKEAVLVPHTSDGRVLFAVPWLGSVVIGTTDTPRDDAPLEPRPMAEELAFLWRETERALGVRLQAQDVKSVWVGLRPLVVSESALSATLATSAISTSQGVQGSTAKMSREHLIAREAPGFLTVTGGKWTTYRVMAQEVMAALVSAGDLPAPQRAAHTQRHKLFGAPLHEAKPVSLRDAPGLHLLGSQADMVVNAPGSDECLGLGLTAAVVRYAARSEWAITVEDMLARRWRVLFLDARLAERMATRVAELLREETGIDPALPAFLALCQQHQWHPSHGVPDA
jgi:glycerol-3-phosphate dehydrogenase